MEADKTMPNWLIRWGLNVFSILFVAYLIKGFEVTFWGAVFGSLVLGVVNAVIRPIIVVLTLPLNVLTLGLFTLVINGMMLWLTSGVVKGFDLQSFGTSIIAALFLSILSMIISLQVRD